MGYDCSPEVAKDRGNRGRDCPSQHGEGSRLLSPVLAAGIRLSVPRSHRAEEETPRGGEPEATTGGPFEDSSS